MQNKKIVKAVKLQMLVILSITLLTAVAVSQESEGIQVDSVNEKVVCFSDPTESYALYLPPGYTKEKKYPLIIAFDPGGVGKRPVEHFRNAASKYGYIVAGSNTSRNGPWEVNIKAANAMWGDLFYRFSIDPKMVIGTGFSGGARTASLLTVIKPSQVAGIILCGAAFAQNVSNSDVRNCSIIGVVGLRDFNYFELLKLEGRLRKAGVRFANLLFDDEHTWPPSEICTRSVEWLEILQMASGQKPRNMKLIEEVYKKEYDFINKVIGENNLFWGHYNSKQLVSLFSDLRNIDDLNAEIRKLEDDERFEDQLEMEEEFEERENNILKDMNAVYDNIIATPPHLISTASIVSKTRIPDLIKILDKNENAFEYNAAYRTLMQIKVDVDDIGSQLIDKQDYRRALAFFGIGESAMKYFEGYPKIQGYFNLAVAYALLGETEKAVHELYSCMESGYKNWKFIEGSDYFTGIKDSPEFKKLIEDMKNAK